MKYLSLAVLLASCAQNSNNLALLKNSVESIVRLECQMKSGGRMTGSCVPYKMIKEISIYRIYFLTASHMLIESEPINISFYFFEDKKPYLVLDKIKVEKIHPTSDIAVLSLLSDKPVATIDINCKPIYFGQKIYSVGFPFDLRSVVDEGMIFRYHEDGLWICTAAAAPGMSGGAILDEQGKLVGIISSGPIGMIKNNGTNIPMLISQVLFIVPIWDLRQWMEVLYG